MENRQEHKNEVSKFISNIDLILYSSLAAAFLFYGVYSSLMDLWSSGVEYFVAGILLISCVTIQIGRDIYHKRLSTASKILLGIWILTTVLSIFLCEIDFSQFLKER